MAQIVVIGLGRFGSHVARTLHRSGDEVLAIDSDPEQVERIKNDCSRAIVLDARDKERLDALGVADFDVAVVSLGELIDVSALIALRLKELGVPRIVTKAGSEDHGKLLSLIGVEQVVYPEQEAAERLARRLHDPNLMDFIPLGDVYSIEEIATPDDFVGKSLAELRLRNRFGVQVLGIRDALTDRLELNPGPQVQLKPSDALLILGRNDELRRLVEA